MKAPLVYVLVGVAAVVVLHVLDVFTWTGIAYTVGFSDGATLWWAAGTRAVTLTLAVATALAGTISLVAHWDWLDAVFEPKTTADRLAIVPRSIRRRARARISWWWAGVKNSQAQTERAAALRRPMLEAGTAVHAARDNDRHDSEAA